MTLRELIQKLTDMPSELLDKPIAIELLDYHGVAVAASTSQFTTYEIFESADESVVIQGIG